jgi:hypothetical protein
MLSWGPAPRQPKNAISALGRALLDRGGVWRRLVPGRYGWPINGAGDGILGDRGDGFEYWVKDASLTAHKSSGEMRDTGRGAAAAKRVVD